MSGGAFGRSIDGMMARLFPGVAMPKYGTPEWGAKAAEGVRRENERLAKYLADKPELAAAVHALDVRLAKDRE